MADWPHSPAHHLEEAGAYMVTAGTYGTFQRSYYARLNYVHQNPVHHGLVIRAFTYPWCSADWFERNAAPAFHRTITGFKTDRVRVPGQL